MPIYHAPLLPVLALLVILTGCNAFETFDAPSETDELSAILNDAQIAIDRGDAETAENLLRHAKTLDPDNFVVNTKLSTALLLKHDIDALDMLKISRALSGDDSFEHDGSVDGALAHSHTTAMSGTTAATEGQICSFPEDHTAEEFNPRTIEPFADFEPGEETDADSADVLHEIRGLIETVMDDEQTNIDTFDVDNEETIQETIDRLRDDDVEDDDIAEAMLNDAIAHLTIAYLEISDEARESYSFYYVTSPDPEDDTYLGYCAPEEDKFEEAEQEAACHTEDIEYTKDLVVMRSEEVLDSQDSIAEEVAFYTDEAHQVFERELTATCSGD